MQSAVCSLRSAVCSLQMSYTGGFESARTHDKSYYPVPQTSMEFCQYQLYATAAVRRNQTEKEAAMKELVEKYRPVRQRTVQGETTKDKAGALPPAVSSKEQDCDRVDLMERLGNDLDLNTEEPIDFTMDEEEKEDDLFVHATSEGGDAPQVTFVDDCLVAVAVAEARTPPDEYEPHSGDDFSDREDEDIAPVTISRSGRPIRAHFRLDL